MSALVSILITILVIAIVVGIIAYIVQSAPFIPEPFKQWAVWVIIAIGLLYLVMYLLKAAPGLTP